MKCLNFLLSLIFFLYINNVEAESYNSHGQTGLISLPSAEIHDEQSIFFTFNKNSYYKIGTLTVTPFKWMEASFFYYRPDDLLWGDTKGLYLDKGFNVKFSYKPKSNLLPRFAIGLDDFAGTGQFTKEYIASTYDFTRFKLTSGIGWGKFVGQSSIDNPLVFLNDRFETRSDTSDNYDLGGNLSYDLWYRGDAVFFGGLELQSKLFKNISYKLETNPYDYFDFGCCGEGKSDQSFSVRKKQSDFNFGISYKFRDYGNLDFSFTQGNSWNISFSLGFSSKKPIKKKNKFKPSIVNNNNNKTNKNDEFYIDLLDNLNNNKLYLQTASLNATELRMTIDSSEHINPIIYSSRSAYIAKKVLEINDISFDTIEVGHLSRGAKINSITYKNSDLDLNTRYPDVLIKKYSKVLNADPKKYLEDKFKPKVKFPVIFHTFAPDIRTHVGSPEKVVFAGLGIKSITEIQLNRNIAINFNIGKSIKDNFDSKVSDPNSSLELVRTEIVNYLQGTNSDDGLYLNSLDIESIWSPHQNIWIKLAAGYLEPMYGGITTEVIYKPFRSNVAIGAEFNSVKKRYYDQRFSFLDYKVSTSHFNLAFYDPKTNILAKWSYGKYLAGDTGYTLDLSRKMPSGWRAGFFFTRTNVSAEDFGEGSFDKGFYFHIPLDIFSKDYSKDSSGFQFRTMTRDGGQKLVLKNRLIDSFYGSTLNEINENWNNYLD